VFVRVLSWFSNLSEFDPRNNTNYPSSTRSFSFTLAYFSLRLCGLAVWLSHEK